MGKKPDFDRAAFIAAAHRPGGKAQARIPKPGSRDKELLELTSLLTMMVDAGTNTVQESLNVSMSVALNFACSNGIGREDFLAACAKAYDAWQAAAKAAALADQEMEGRA